MTAAEQIELQTVINSKIYYDLIETNHTLAVIASRALKDLAERDELIRALGEELNFYKGARCD